MTSVSLPAPKPILQNPMVLLLTTGILFGFNFPLGKIAAGAGISPLLWAAIPSVGVVSLLLPILSANKRLVLPKGSMVRYVMLSAVISFVLPNILLFSVIPHVGAGFTGLMFALSPVFTLALATLFRFKAPNKLGILGVSIGFVGAIIVSVSRGTAPEAPPVLWLFGALSIPIVLAVGNVYRSIDWPTGADADALAFWGHLFALPVFGILALTTEAANTMHLITELPLAVLAQMLVSAIMFPIYFRLQKEGGPVLLSQIGYVSAAVGLLLATVVLGEIYSAITWLGALIIAIGIITTIRAQQR
ncbi:MAG: DMT family transporter [Kordiimonas sp.]